jgi:hypothetical protein
MPFVQGRLRQESLSFVIETECAHCREPIRIEMDSKMQYRLAEPAKEPVVYVPMLTSGRWRNLVSSMAFDANPSSSGQKSTPDNTVGQLVVNAGCT